MAQFNFDLSEYKHPKNNRCSSQWQGCDDLSLSFHQNSVSYDREAKKLCVKVTPAYEFSAVLGLCYDLGLPVPAAYTEDLPDEEIERRHNELQKICARFEPVLEVQPPDDCYPFESLERGTNAFSGTKINVPLGEGLLNFCYADFDSAFDRCAPVYRALKQDAPAKIHSAKEGMIHLHELYVEVFTALSEVFYSSIYTACFPPQFTRKTERALNYFRQYLTLLQAEFLELIEFCLDKEYRPSVLGQLYPSERYALWCRIKEESASHTRQETFVSDSREPHGTTMPFGADLGDSDRELSLDIDLTPEQKAFAQEFDLPEHELRLSHVLPCFISVSYGCDNLRDMLYLEFTKILESGVQFQKCKRCGRYFIVKGNYHGTYCDRIPEGEHRTCQQLAAQEAYLNKLRDNDGENPLNTYQKYYKRYFARVKAGSLKQEKFKQWQYEAVQKRDDCLQGRISLIEFTDWLEGSMPNRDKRRK